LEPTADIGHQRRVDGTDAKNADEQAVSNIERPNPAKRRQRSAEPDHASADEDRPENADPIGQDAERDSAYPGPECRQPVGECGGSAGPPANLGGHLGERNYGNEWGPKPTEMAASARKATAQERLLSRVAADMLSIARWPTLWQVVLPVRNIERRGHHQSRAGNRLDRRDFVEHKEPEQTCQDKLEI
jgi:hypothetical protein